MFLSFTLWSYNGCIENINKQHKQPKKVASKLVHRWSTCKYTNGSAVHGSFFWSWCSEFVFFSLHDLAHDVALRNIKFSCNQICRSFQPVYYSCECIVLFVSPVFVNFFFFFFFLTSASFSSFSFLAHDVVTSLSGITLSSIRSFSFESNAMWNVCVHTELWIRSWNGWARSLCARFDSI